MAPPYHQVHQDLLSSNHKSDINQNKIHQYIILLENYQRLKGNLQRGLFEVTVRQLAKELGLSLATISRNLKKLEEKGIIARIKIGSHGREPSIYAYLCAVNDESIFRMIEDIKSSNKKTKGQIVPSSETTNETTNETTSETVKTSENTNNKIDENLETTKVNKAKEALHNEEAKEQNETVGETVHETTNETLIKEYIKKDKKNIYTSVIDYLNLKTGKTFKSSTEKTKRKINARIREGFVEENFFKVIDIKVSQWIDTDMEKYLRPETLFGTKMEGYLNESPVSKKRRSYGESISDKSYENYTVNKGLGDDQYFKLEDYSSCDNLTDEGVTPWVPKFNI